MNNTIFMTRKDFFFLLTVARRLYVPSSELETVNALAQSWDAYTFESLNFSELAVFEYLLEKCNEYAGKLLMANA